MIQATILPANNDTIHPKAVINVVPRAKAPAIFQRVTAYPATIGSMVATVFVSES